MNNIIRDIKDQQAVHSKENDTNEKEYVQSLNNLDKQAEITKKKITNKKAGAAQMKEARNIALKNAIDAKEEKVALTAKDSALHKQCDFLVY